MTTLGRKRRKDSTPLTLIASALAAAELEPDKDVAKRYGVGSSTIKVWRHRSLTDDELGALVEAERIRVLDGWRIEIGKLAIATAKEIRRRIDAQEEIQFELIAVLKTSGQLATEASALLGPVEPRGKQGETPDA